MDDDLSPPLSHPLEEAPRAVGDNFPGYIGERFGLQYDAEALMTESERGFVASLKTMPFYELTQRSSASGEELTALERVRLMHALRPHAAHDASIAAELLAEIEALLGDDAFHAAVAYDELCEEGIFWALYEGDLALAERLVERGQALFEPSWFAVDLCRGALAWARGEREQARRAWAKFIQPDQEKAANPEAAYDVAEWLSGEASSLASPDSHSAALDYLKESERLAEELGQRAVLVDVALLRDQLFRGER